MSKSKPPKKKVVVTSKKKSTTNKKVSASPHRSRRTEVPQEALVFGKDNYMWMGIGIGLIVLGLILMSGGQMPSPEVWDDNIIYSFRRTTLAPILILAGLALEVYAIFKK